MPTAKPHLQDLVRTDSADIRGDFVRLDRNDRASALPQEVLREIFATFDPGALSSYPDPKPLIEAFAASVDLPASHMVATNGSDAAIRRAFQAFVAPGDDVVMADPSYAMYSVYTRIAQARAVQLDYGVDLALPADRWLRAVSNGPRMICLSNPDNPTGAVLPRAQVIEIVAAAARRDVICLVDEAYYPSHNETVIGAVRDYPNLIVTRSLSKAYGLGGVRAGFACAQPVLIQALAKVKGLHEVNAMAVHAGCYLLARPEVVRGFLAEFEAGRAVLAQFARRHNFGLPACPTNFQLIALPDRLDASALVAELRKRGFLIKGGFGHPLSHCVRVTLNGPEIMQQFVDVFEDVLTASTPQVASTGRDQAQISAVSHRGGRTLSLVWATLALAWAAVIYAFSTSLAIVLMQLPLNPVSASHVYSRSTRWHRPRGKRFDDVARLDYWTLLAMRWSTSFRWAVRQSVKFPIQWIRRSWRDVERHGSVVEKATGKSLPVQWMESITMFLRRPLTGLDSLPPYYSLGGFTPGGKSNTYLWVTAMQRVTGLLWAKTIESLGRRDLAVEDKAVFSGFLTRNGLRGPRIVALLSGGEVSPAGSDSSGDVLPPVNLFVKPAVGAGGLGTSLWIWENGAYREARSGKVLPGPQLLEELRRATRKGRALLLQEQVQAGADLAELVGQAATGLRLISCNGPNGFRIILCALKVARGNSITDNIGGGAAAFPIDPVTGEIAQPFGQPAIEPVVTSPANGRTLVGLKIPRWAEIVETVAKAHSCVEGLCIAGWDLTLANEGVVFFECNPQFDLFHVEAASGSPLGACDDVVSSLLENLEQYCSHLGPRTEASKTARFPNRNEGGVDVMNAPGTMNPPRVN